jgi:hypothetical protein
MGFLTGSVTYECFRMAGTGPDQLGPEQIEMLEQSAISEKRNPTLEQAQVGFSAGDHLFDREFDLEKNIIAEALHFGVRIDTNQIPATIRRAWLQMELAAIRVEAPERRPTKAERQEAKEAVEARCQEAARSGQYVKMQQFPVLWDAPNELLFLGTTSPTASDVGREFLEKRMGFEVHRLTSGRLADEWAGHARKRGALNQIDPSNFQDGRSLPAIQWWNGQADDRDYLGNEFLLWLWWHWETKSDVVELPDGSTVTGMFARSLSLECPLGESGKGTISSEAPTVLPEASQAIATGKLPRKAGLTLVRHDQQYELALQPETFSISGAKLQLDEDISDPRDRLVSRVEGLRELHETMVLLFHAFLQQRIDDGWNRTLTKMRNWLKSKR